MAAPKRRTSHSKKRMRSSTKFLRVINTIECSNCSSFIFPHMICDHCGFYKNKQILKL